MRTTGEHGGLGSAPSLRLTLHNKARPGEESVLGQLVGRGQAKNYGSLTGRLDRTSIQQVKGKWGVQEKP